MNPPRFICALLTLILSPLIVGGIAETPRADSPRQHPAATTPPHADHSDPATLRLAAVELEPARVVDLNLERFDILDPAALIVIAGAEGEFETLAPAITLYRGTIPGDPDSLVVAARSLRGIAGLIRSAGQTRAIAQTPSGFKTVPFDDTPITTQLCAINAHADDFTPGWPEPTPQSNRTNMPGTMGRGGEPPCRVASIAIDTDWEFTQKFGDGGVEAAAEYAVFLIGTVGEIYRRDLNVRLNVTYLRLWSDDADPWDNSATLYNQFSSHWNANMLAVPRDTALMLSGRLDQLFAGEASIASLCITDDAYAVATKLNASFPFPIQNQSPSNWDLFVTAHELGHNFGSIHTHEYTPPIDACGTGNCSSADLGTIMSYCHLCTGGNGGVNNINLQFHPRVIDTMLAYLGSAPCDLTIAGNQAADDHAFAAELLPTTIDVLLNDQMISCATVAIESFDPISANGAAVELIPAGTFGRERLRYTPPIGAGPTDTFTYAIADGNTASVTIDIAPLRAPDITGAILPGVDVEYFVIQDVPALPDYDTLAPYDDQILSLINFPASVAPFAGSGRASFVGARFDGFIDVTTPGLYTLYLASDDGSRLSIGNDILIDNDGIHTMTEKSAVIGLQTGRHRVRIDFFERTRSAGLVVSWQGPGITKQPIPAARWFQSVPCPGDRNLDTTVDVDDLNIVLSQWGMSVPPNTGGDESGDGQVTVNDLNIILSNWANTCP